MLMASAVLGSAASSNGSLPAFKVAQMQNPPWHRGLSAAPVPMGAHAEARQGLLPGGTSPSTPLAPGHPRIYDASGVTPTSGKGSTVGEASTVQGKDRSDALEMTSGAVSTPQHIPQINPSTNDAGLELMVSHLRAALRQSELKNEATNAQVSSTIPLLRPPCSG